jgi:hypothetical protein
MTDALDYLYDLERWADDAMRDASSAYHRALAQRNGYEPLADILEVSDSGRLSLNADSWEDWTRVLTVVSDYTCAVDTTWGRQRRRYLAGDPVIDKWGNAVTVWLTGAALAHARLHFSDAKAGSFENEQRLRTYARSLINYTYPTRLRHRADDPADLMARAIESE